jgi:hypothetical protein
VSRGALEGIGPATYPPGDGADSVWWPVATVDHRGPNIASTTAVRVRSRLLVCERFRCSCRAAERLKWRRPRAALCSQHRVAPDDLLMRVEIQPTGNPQSVDCIPRIGTRNPELRGAAHGRLRRDALGHRDLPWPGEFLDGYSPTRHRHQKCFSGAGDLWAVTVLPRDVGRC